MLNFREEKEKWIFYSQASRRERESENNFSVFEKEREIFDAVPKFWEEKEKSRVHNF